MERVPEIKIEFSLEKLDAEEMNRHAEQAALNLTLIPAGAAEYRVLVHASWTVTLPKTETWALEEPMNQMRKRFSGKATDVRALCKEYGLAAFLTVHIYADVNTMPQVELSEADMAFWSSLGTKVQFDFALD